MSGPYDAMTKSRNKREAEKKYEEEWHKNDQTKITCGGYPREHAEKVLKEKKRKFIKQCIENDQKKVRYKATKNKIIFFSKCLLLLNQNLFLKKI